MDHFVLIGKWGPIASRAGIFRRSLLVLILLSLMGPIALSPGAVSAEGADAVSPVDDPEVSEIDDGAENEVPGEEGKVAAPDPASDDHPETDQPDEEASGIADSNVGVSVAGADGICPDGLGVAVSGHVRSGDQGYETNVVLMAVYSNHQNDLGWPAESSNSDASGAYTFCITDSLRSNLEWVTRLRVVAVAKPTDLSERGDSFSAPVAPDCASTSSGCTIDVQMQAPNVTGEVRNASTARISVALEPGDEWFQAGYSFSLRDSKFSIALPFAAEQYMLRAGAGQINGAGPPYFVDGEWIQSPVNGRMDFGVLELDPANLVVEVTRPSGFEFFEGSLGQIMLVSPSPECDALSGVALAEAFECLTGLERIGVHRGIARVVAGSHRIIVDEQGFAPVEVVVTVGVNGLTAVSSGGMLSDGRVVVALAEPPIVLAVGDVPVGSEYLGLRTSTYSESSDMYEYEWRSQPGSLAEDRFGWAPTKPGIYRLEFQTQVGSVAKVSEHIVGVVQTDIGMAIEGRCYVDVTLARQVVTCLNSASTPGAQVFDFGEPDLLVEVCGLSSCEEGSFAVALNALQTHLEGGDSYFGQVFYLWGASSVGMTLARTGRHELVAQTASYGEQLLLRPSRKVVHLTRDDPLGTPRGELRVAECVERSSVSCDPVLTSVAGTTTLHMQLSTFPLIGEIWGPRFDSGEVVPMERVHLRINSTDGGSGWGWASTNSDGKFGVDLPVGAYSVHVNPQQRYRHLAATRFEFRVVDDGDGGVTTSVLPFVLTFQTPNAIGQLYGAGDLNFGWLNADASQWREGFWQYSASSRIDVDGRYRFSLPPGRWRITVDPNHYGSALALLGAGAVEFDVANDGTMDLNAADVHLPPTNLRLQVKARAADGSLNNFANGYARLEVDVDGSWSSEPLISSQRSLTAKGWLGFAVPPGRYRLTVMNHGSSPEVVTTQRYVMVQEGDATALCMTGVQPSAWPESCDGWEINPTTLVMDGANLRGEVRAGGDAARAWVSAARWNGLNFEWSNHWAWADESGRFGLRLSPGTYQISLQPLWSSEYVQTRVYVRVVAVGDAVQWCRVSVVHGVPGNTCVNGDQLTSDLLSVQLNSTNLHGQVVQAADTNLPVRGTWIRVEREHDGIWNYWQHVSVGDDGRFRTRIDNEMPGTPVKFRLVVDPPQHASNLLLSRRVVELWAGDLDGDGEIVVCRAQPDDGGCEESDRVVGDLLITLDAGNLIGTVWREVIVNGVTQPGTPVVGARVEFQRREHGHWSWFDYWAFTNNEGRYSADLPPGEYRITVHPPFAARSQMAPVRREFTVDAGESLTEDFLLPTPNVVVTLTVTESGADIPAQGAWIYLERRRSGDEGWDFLDMHTHTDAQGMFSFHVPETGDYRMVIHPPWNSSNAVRFMREFVVSEAGVVTGLESTISFPMPNLELTVHRPAGLGETLTQPMPSVHVYLLALQVYNEGGPNEWRWVDGGHTNRLGEVGFLITEPGDYRVVVQAPWNRPEFVGFEKDITVTDDEGPLQIEQLAMPLVYPRANVEGVVRVDELRVNRFGWLIAWKVGASSETVEWSGHNDQSGRFGLRLGEGVYRLEAHPNWDFRDRGNLSLGPIDVMVTVSAQGQVTACAYMMGGANCLIDGLIDISLDHLPPNFVVTAFVTDGVPAVGALVRLTSDGRSWDFIADSEGKIAAAVRPGTFTVRVAAIVAGTVRVVSQQNIEHSGGPEQTSVVMTLLTP